MCKFVCAPIPLSLSLSVPLTPPFKGEKQKTNKQNRKVKSQQKETATHHPRATTNDTLSLQENPKLCILLITFLCLRKSRGKTNEKQAKEELFLFEYYYLFIYYFFNTRSILSFSSVPLPFRGVSPVFVSALPTFSYAMHWGSRRPGSRQPPPVNTNAPNATAVNSRTASNHHAHPQGPGNNPDVDPFSTPYGGSGQNTTSSAPSPFGGTLPDSPIQFGHGSGSGHNMAHPAVQQRTPPTQGSMGGGNSRMHQSGRHSTHTGILNNPQAINANNSAHHHYNMSMNPNMNNGMTGQSTPRTTSSSLHMGATRRSITQTTNTSMMSGANTANNLNMNHSAMPQPRREAVAISGAHTAAANANTTGIFSTGTRTTFTNPSWQNLTPSAPGVPGGIAGVVGSGAGAGPMNSSALTNAALTANMAAFGNMQPGPSSNTGVAPASVTSLMRAGVSGQQGSPPQQGSGGYGSVHGLSATMNGANPNAAPMPVTGDPLEEELLSLFMELQSAVTDTVLNSEGNAAGDEEELQRNNNNCVDPSRASSVPSGSRMMNGSSNASGPSASFLMGPSTTNSLFRGAGMVNSYLNRRSMVSSSNVEEILVDLIAAIEMRSLASLDPMSRDLFVEHRIRDLLSELRHMETNNSLLLSIHIIELLLPIDYTSPPHKFIRLCRALSNIIQSPLEVPRKEAQRVFGLMLEYDAKYHSEPPLKVYLTKDIREQVGIANLHLQARSGNHNNRKQFPTQLLYFVMSVEEIAKVSPKYIATPTLRDDIIRIATACCVSEPQLEAAAYECLVAVFKSSSVLNPKDIIRENKMICSKCEILNSARYNEVSVICQLKVLKALFTSRPSVLSSDKTKISAAVTAQFAPSKSPEVRMTVCDLLPIIAPWDIQNPSRRNAYCAFIMEPVKNVRDNRRKSEELTNIALFIRAVGYDVLDAASRNNLDSILLRYIAMPDIQEACWRVIAAILSMMNPRAHHHHHHASGPHNVHSFNPTSSNYKAGVDPSGKGMGHGGYSGGHHRGITSSAYVAADTNVGAGEGEVLEQQMINAKGGNASSVMVRQESNENMGQRGPLPAEDNNSNVNNSTAPGLGSPSTGGGMRPRRYSFRSRRGSLTGSNTPTTAAAGQNPGFGSANPPEGASGTATPGEGGLPPRSTPAPSTPQNPSGATNVSFTTNPSDAPQGGTGDGVAAKSPCGASPAHTNTGSREEPESAVSSPGLPISPGSLDVIAGSRSSSSVRHGSAQAYPNNGNLRMSVNSGVATPHNRYSSGSSPIPSNSSSSRLMLYTAEDLVGRCIPFIRKAQLTAELVSLLQQVKEALPALEKAVQTELNELVETALKEAVLQQPQQAKRNQPAGSQNGGSGGPTGPCATTTPNSAGLQSSFGGPLGPSASSSFHMAVAASTLPRQTPTTSRFVNPKEGVTSIVHMSALTGGSPSQMQPAVFGGGPKATPATEGAFTPGASSTGTTLVSSGLTQGSAEEVPKSATTPDTPGAAGTMARGSSANTAESLGLMNLAGSSMDVAGQPAPHRKEHDLSVALDLISQREVTSVTQLDELEASIAPFQRHSDPKVRLSVYRAIMRAMASWIRYARERKESTHSAVIINMLEAYIKNAPQELNSASRQEAVSLLASTECFQTYLVDRRILSVLHGFLSSTPRTREIAVDLLFAIMHNFKTSVLAPIQQALGVTVDACVMVLEYSDDVQMLFRGMEDLRSYTKLGVRFLTGHLTRIFRALQKRLEDPAVGEMIVLCALKTLDCVLAAVNKDERAIFRYEDDILQMYPVAVKILCRNSSHAISLASIDVLVSLNKMMSSPLQVVDHQTLVEVLTRVYIATNSTRKEVVNILSLLGQLGAVDPALREHEARQPKRIVNPQAIPSNMTAAKGSGIGGAAPAAAVAAAAAELPLHAASWLIPEDEITFDSAAQDYTVIVYRALSRLVGSAHSEAVSTQALRTLLQFVRFTQDQKDHVDGVTAAQSLIQIAKRTNESPALRIEALRVLAAICSLRHEKIVRSMLPEIVVLLEQIWAPTDYPLFSVTLDVVSALKPGKLSEKEHSESWEWLYPRLMDVAVQDRSESRELCLRVVEIILTASYIPPHCLPIIFPVLQRFMQQSGQLVEVRSQSLCAAVHLVCDLKAPQYTTSLMQGIRTITRHCELREDLGPRFATIGMMESLKVLSALLPVARGIIRQLLEYVQPKVDPQAERIISKSPPPCVGPASIGSTYGINYASNCPSTASNLLGMPANSIPNGRTSMHPEASLSDEEEEEGAALAVPDEMPTPNAQDIAVFLKHIEWGATRKKMRDWFAELQKYIILVSPHPAIRMMADLVSKHDPLRRELFNPSFKAIYEVLTAEQLRKVNAVMTSVLNGNDTELTSQCLALADYLDHHPPRIAPEVLQELKNIETASAEAKLSKQAAAAAAGVGASQLIPQLPIFGLGLKGAGMVSAINNTSSMTPNPPLGSDSHTAGVNNNSTLGLDRSIILPNGTPGRDSYATISTSDFKSASTSLNHRHMMESGGVLSPNPQAVDFLLRRHAEQTYSGYLLPERGESLIDYPRQTGGNALHYLSPVGRMPIDPYPTEKVNLFTPENIVKAVERTRLYDKAFNFFESRLICAMHHYQFNHMPWDVVHSIALPLAWLYNKRDMHTSVIGLFDAIQYKGETDAGRGYELLGAWEDAQRVYAKAIGGDISKVSTPLRLVEGYIRSLFFSAEWTKALQVALSVTSETLRSSFTISRCGATAAWILGRWDDVASLSNPMAASERSNTHVQQLFTHVHQLHKAVVTNEAKEYEALRVQVHNAKLSVDESVRTLLPLSYTHAYDCVAILQHYTEIEELVDYCTSKQQKRQGQLLQRWENRFQKLKSRNPQPTLNTLLILSVVLSTREMSSMILHFSEAMSSEYPKLTQWAMNWLQDGVLPSTTHPFSLSRPVFINSNPEVNVGYISHMWSQGRREEAITELEHFLQENRVQLEKKSAKIYAAAELKLGKWKQEMLVEHSWNKENTQEEFSHFYRAIRADPSSYEAWHSWALINYRVQQRQESLEDQRKYVEAAHQGFAASICRCQCAADALPAIMRLLQLWVIHNGVALLKEMVADIISRIPVDYWVQAIPQLIGHLTNESYDIREVITMILKLLCEKHPQAVIFPLLVVSMSDEENHRIAPQQRKKELVKSIIQNCPKQVRVEAETVAKLLVDVSAIPIEKIREHLSEVAAAWNPNTEFEVDREEVERRLLAALEIFNVNRRHLIYTIGDIGRWVRTAMDDEAQGDRVKALGIVKQLVEEMSKHVAEKLGKEPQRAIEPLLRLRNLSIAVFGEYDIADPFFPTITSFSSALEVIPSKKRPRKIQLSGSDGRLYSYCLKGNEDIRMDERVMQLFGMVNVLLQHARVTSASSIHRFPVIPISSSVGLLGWVQKASTINSIICDYRANVSQMRAHQESSVLRNYVESIGQWEKLSIIHRTEALDYVMHQKTCAAMDVANAMWYCANTAEQWLDRRITYTVSLATMSMVGYVLGLGDRHLGNILLSMSTGKVVHIDFGDSFEVGRLRHVLPETIPFRLTRMLSNTMEVFGVNGSFRSNATRTQHILRLERDSIMSLLSAFVYDPIVQHKGKVKSIMEKSRSPQDVVERIRRKLHGTELAVADDAFTMYHTTPESSRRPDLLYMSKVFDAEAQRIPSMAFSAEKQVNFLIDESTRIDNYTVLFVGWGPLW
eukprot:gene5790-4141_t